MALVLYTQYFWAKTLAHSSLPVYLMFQQFMTIHELVNQSYDAFMGRKIKALGQC